MQVIRASSFTGKLVGYFGGTERLLLLACGLQAGPLVHQDKEIAAVNGRYQSLVPDKTQQARCK